MQRVRGIGGIFFKSRDPKALATWYAENLGLEVQEGWNGVVFKWAEHTSVERPGSTIWSAFAEDTKYFEPSTASFMLNFRVDNLAAMLEQLKARGAKVDEKVESSEFGSFGWCFDPEGNKIELWEPPIETPDQSGDKDS